MLIPALKKEGYLGIRQYREAYDILCHLTPADESEINDPQIPLSEPRRGEFRRRAANTRANRTGNAACQEIVFESLWRAILHNYFFITFICTF